MKAIEQYFPVVLFILLYKVVLTFESEDKILVCDQSNYVTEAVEQCFYLILFIMKCKGVLTSSILQFDNLIGIYWVVLYCGKVIVIHKAKIHLLFFS